MYISRPLRVGLLGALFLGLIGSSPVQADPKIPTKLIIEASMLFSFLAVSSLIAAKQDEQPELKDGSLLEKAINWYRRVVCGQISKKYKKLKPDGSVKNAYTESSGLFGTVLSVYNKHIKDIKTSIGVGAIPTLILLGQLGLIKNPWDFLAGFVKGAPGSEFIAPVKEATSGISA